VVALALRLHSRWGRLARQATEHCRQMSVMALTLLVVEGLPSPVAQIGLTCRVAQAGPASDSALPAAAAPEPHT
jgi:hypothetical protein